MAAARNPGSIPACAGEPRQSGLKPSRTRVYPRVCGGTTRLSGSLPQHSGLSPRVRGNHIAQILRFASQRSIPACAGEPATRKGCGVCNWVYPRVCGGTAGGSGTPSTRKRSIPACAGEPQMIGQYQQRDEVYPRVCGGTVRAGAPPIRVVGLSPRVRGNPPARLRPSSAARSIPACAGEPTAATHLATIPRVYPRVCGGTIGLSEWI